MKKAKLIASLSLLPTLAIAPIFISSCSQSGSYTIMNVDSPCVISAAKNQTTDLKLVTKEPIYIYGPDHKVVPIVASKSKVTIGGTYADCITNAEIKQYNEQSVNITVSITDKWIGQTMGDNDIYLDVEFALSTKTPIQWRIFIKIIPQYFIKGVGDLIRITPGTEYSQALCLIENELQPEPEIPADSWKVITKSGFEDSIHFKTDAGQTNVLVIEP